MIASRPVTRRRLGSAALAAAAAAVLAGSAGAASAPTAVTGAVTAFSATTATVTGTVNPNGLATTWSFEYGKSTGYGSSTPSTSAGAGTVNVSATATIADLAPATTYHYRFVAVNGSGTATGADGVFTTAAAPLPAAVTGSASNLSANAATLNGSVNPNGRPTTWHFEAGTSTGYGTSTPAQNAGAGTGAVAVSAPLTGLQAGRTYHFRLVATSDAGTTRGADQTFRLGAAPVATTGAASSVAATTARLNGSVDPNAQETSWHFDYGTSTGYGSSTAARSAGSGGNPTGVSFSLSGLVSGTTYHFRLVAANASGTSVGADRTFVTLGAPAVQTGSAQSVSATTAILTGSVDPKNHTTSWHFEYGTSTRYGSRTPTSQAKANTGNRGVSAGVTKLAPGTTYHFRLVASSSAGTSRSADATFTTAAGVTLTHTGFHVVYGRGILLSGSSSSGQSGIQVTVLAQRLGDASFATVASVPTGAGGTWSYLARPTISTTYEVSANGVTSAPVTIGVRPAVSLRVSKARAVTTHVRASSSFAGRRVQLQRRANGRWTTVRRARLGRSSTVTFPASSLPRGRSTIRIAMSVNQAGAGYLGGFSRVVAYRR
jgi:hypothetical protein